MREPWPRPLPPHLKKLVDDYEKAPRGKKEAVEQEYAKENGITPESAKRERKRAQKRTVYCLKRSVQGKN